MGKFSPGDSVAFSSSFMNDLVGLVEHRGRAAADTLSSNDKPTIIKVKNISGATVEYNSVMGLVGVGFDDGGSVAENLLLYFRRGLVVFDVDIVKSDPESEEPQTHEFCVLKDSIKNGEMGEAWVAGIFPAKVTVDEDNEESLYAELTDGETHLTAAASGPVSIVWKESGTGMKWALVRMAGGAGEFEILRPEDPYTWPERETDAAITTTAELSITKPGTWDINGLETNHDGIIRNEMTGLYWSGNVNDNMFMYFAPVTRNAQGLVVEIGPETRVIFSSTTNCAI